MTSSVPNLNATVGEAPVALDTNRNRRLRHWKDSFARTGIAFGGISVIMAVCLIFFYLMWEVLPLFRGATIEPISEYSQISLSDSDEAISISQNGYFAIEEQNEISYQIQPNGLIHFFTLETGALIDTFDVFKGEPNGEIIIGDNDLHLAVKPGKFMLFKPAFNHLFDENQVRSIKPILDYPFEETWQDAEFDSASVIAFKETEDGVAVLTSLASGELLLNSFLKQESMFEETLELIANEALTLPVPAEPFENALLGPDLRWLYLIGKHSVEVYDFNAPTSNDIKKEFFEFDIEKTRISVSTLLLGGNSLLLGTEQGMIKQLFLVRDDQNEYALHEVREFLVGSSAITQIVPEQRRKGFMATTEDGDFAIFNATAHRSLLQMPLASGEPQSLAISPRANHMMTYTEGSGFVVYSIENEHPEISWSSLWQRVWYEGYQEPEFIWQSSAANNDFEPKYSLVPLAFGTIKAAIYAMIISIPLAICGALYTAYFMAPAIRSKVKPAVELMEALPTVILGFLAGLWLAPLLEDKLPGIFALLIILPFGIIAASLVHFLLPTKISRYIDDGMQAMVLIPVILLFGWLALSISGPLEQLFFSGDVRGWLTNEMGINYDQRNALVVGLAMGFAVIPTIFSIAEDALFAVPKHLSYGSLALGATPWQTVIRVVLPTASPGIFSAIMIGFGRAVGETMIVLMATGNTPIMDMNIFEGLRTLSANIAVEMPEAEKNSTHYRILFLAALVLFAFTFVFNTSAEYVRQRLREKYGAL